MEQLPLGMTKTPKLWNVDSSAFLSFLSWSVSNEPTLDEFEKDSGKNLKNLVNAGPFAQMIDKETGYAKEMMRDFADWLVVNHWGEEE